MRSVVVNLMNLLGDKSLRRRSLTTEKAHLGLPLIRYFKKHFVLKGRYQK